MNKLTIWLCLTLLLPVAALAQAPDEAIRYGLSGVKAVYLVVQDLQEDFVKDGLREEALRGEVEELLRAGGLEIPELADALDASMVQGTLRLAIEGTIASTANRVYNVHLEFRQRVSLVRNPEIKLAATTWYAGDFGMSPQKDMLEIKSTVRDLVAKFLADYRMANPKPKK